MENNLVVLNEIHKGTVTGMESLDQILDKVGDMNFKDDLVYQFEEYKNILSKLDETYEKLGGERLDDPPPIQKTMGWTSIQVQTMMDKSNSHISELLIQGNTMGIIKGVKQLNQNPDCDEEVKEIVNEFVKMQENNIEKLKTYL